MRIINKDFAWGQFLIPAVTIAFKASCLAIGTSYLLPASDPSSAPTYLKRFSPGTDQIQMCIKETADPSLVSGILRSQTQPIKPNQATTLENVLQYLYPEAKVKVYFPAVGGAGVVQKFVNDFPTSSVCSNIAVEHKPKSNESVKGLFSENNLNGLTTTQQANKR